MSTRSTKRARSEAERLSVKSCEVLYDYGKMIRGELIRRYKRFLADVVVSGSASINPQIITVYCPNTGPMLNLLEAPKAAVLLSKSDNKKRKYEYTLEMIEVDNGRKKVWVGIHSALANQMVDKALNMRLFPELGEYVTVMREVCFGTKRSRVDFVLGYEAQQKLTYVEVKSVTLAYTESELAPTSNYAVFPDTVSKRAQKHVAELIELVTKSRDKCASNQQIKAAIVFLVQRDDVERFSPSTLHDPQFASLCIEAEKHGVLLLAIARTIVEYAPNRYQVILAGRLPVVHTRSLNNPKQ